MSRSRLIIIAVVALDIIASAAGASARTRIARRLRAQPVATDTISVATSADSLPTIRAKALSALSLDTILAEPAPVIEDPAPPKTAEVTILGQPEIDAEQMTAFIQRHNPDFDPDIARAFIEVGLRYGVRGDIALCQSILETGWFKFGGGTAVTPDQHNYCGLGVTRMGLRGSIFDTIEDGVTAQIQHLYAYACKLPLPEGETLLDPRFKLVERGVAPTWRGLNRRWAANDFYSDRILNLFDKMRDFKP